MIITNLGGGLGNQLFQYAAGRFLAHTLNTELKMDISMFATYTLHKYCLQHFQIKATVADFSDLKKMRYQYAEHGFQFDPQVATLPNDTIISGYWQSERYFSAMESILREELQIISAPSLPNVKLAERIKSVNAVSLHIRRGDYATNPTTFDYHGICDLNYYAQCINEMVKHVAEPQFFVFSDDPQWVADHLKIGFPTTFVTENNADTNFEDLRLMSLCQHHIIANSTFSWWGAWLNPSKRKIVMAPKKWFNQAPSNTKDLLPEGWLKF